MRKMLIAVLSLLIVTSCVVYPARYGRHVVVEPEFWGTVSYFDPGSQLIDIDYIGATGRHYTRRVYYEPTTTWEGVRYSELHTGDQIWVNGRQENGRYRVERIRRH